MHAAISIEIPPTLTDAVTANLGETDLARRGLGGVPKHSLSGGL
jgi:hypothetical protein